MTQSTTPSKTSKPLRGPANAFTTITVVSFSMTLFAGSLAVLAGLLPLRSVSSLERLDIATVLFVAPVVALVLAVVLEASRFALSSKPLPEPRRQQIVRTWSPGRREG